jgi:diguanylate cyclase (GGDEF)-like protein
VIRLVKQSPDSGSALYAVIEWLSTLPARLLTFSAVTLVGVIAFADWFTGPELACNVGYLLPVFLAATGGRRAGLGVAAFAAVIWTAVEMESRTHPYTSAIVPYWNPIARFAVLSLVASLVATLTAKLAQERGLSRTDPLTGLPNIRAFHEAATAEIHRMRRTGGALTAAYLDIDDFKAVNDAHGHAAGDELLVLAARTMTGALRGTDLVARLGGDEFALLLPGASLADAVMRLRTVHSALAAVTTSCQPSVGFSIGAVTFTDPPHSGDHLIAHADRIMYGVKQHGKNTVWAEPAGTTSGYDQSLADPAGLVETS